MNIMKPFFNNDELLLSNAVEYCLKDVEKVH